MTMAPHPFLLLDDEHSSVRGPDEAARAIVRVRPYSMAGVKGEKRRMRTGQRIPDAD